MKCPYCDAIVPRGKTVCGFCGEPLPEMNPPVRSSKDEAGSFSPDKGPTPVSTEASMTHERLQNDDNNGYYLQEERQSHVEVENKTPEESELEPVYPTKTLSGGEKSECKTDRIEEEKTSSVGGSKRRAGTRKRLIATIAIFLCGIAFGALFFNGQWGNLFNGEGKSPEAADGETLETTAAGDQEKSDTTTSKTNSHPVDAVDEDATAPIGDDSSVENSPKDKSETPLVLPDSSTINDFKEQIESPPIAASIAADQNFNGVWSTYLANSDGTPQYDADGEMIFTGDFIVVDLENKVVFNLGEGGVLSQRWSIELSDRSDMISFWAENGYYSVVHLLSDSLAKEISGTSSTSYFNLIWFKIDSEVPEYDSLTSEDVSGKDNSQIQNGASSSSKNSIGEYALYPGVPDFGQVNGVSPYDVIDLDGGGRVYIYLHSDLQKAGTYTMSYNLYDQELLNYGFTQSGTVDTGSETNTAMSYGKTENGTTTVVIVNPLDSYGGFNCMSVVVGRTT